MNEKFTWMINVAFVSKLMFLDVFNSYSYEHTACIAGKPECVCKPEPEASAQI